MTAAPPRAATPVRSRLGRAWTLQTRLIVTVIGFVSMLLIAIALATGAILSSILQQSLDPRLVSSFQTVRIHSPQDTAADVLQSGRGAPGFLLVLRINNNLSGAYVSTDESVVELTAAQIAPIVEASNGTFATVSVPDLGDYRILAGGQPGVSLVVGCPSAARRRPSPRSSRPSRS